MTAPTALSPARPAKSHIEITVIYAGLTKTFTVTPHQTIQSLLELALNAFGVHNNRHTQSLYSSAGVELADAQSLEAAGVAEGSQLLLRPSQVKGGVELVTKGNKEVAA